MSCERSSVSLSLSTILVYSECVVLSCLPEATDLAMISSAVTGGLAAVTDDTAQQQVRTKYL